MKEIELPEFEVPEKNPVGRPPKKRGRGRPKKGERVAPKPMKVPKKVTPKNRLKYAEETIRNAERIYMKYESEYPNPLNIDDKNLLPEAKTAWEFVFTMRQPSDLYKKREKAIHNGEELLFLFESYCKYIRDNNFMKSFENAEGEVKMMPLVPNQANLAAWLGIRRKTISNAVYEDKSGETAKEYRAMLADLLSEGAMIGAYASSSTIFSLKNMCDWAEKFEDRSRPDTKVTVEEAEALMRELGYIERPKLEAGNE